MTPPPAPLRFLLLVIGCWAGARALTLLPNQVEAAEILASADPAGSRGTAAAAGDGARDTAGPMATDDVVNTKQPTALSSGREGIATRFRSMSHYEPTPLATLPRQDRSSPTAFTLPAPVALAVRSDPPLATRAAPPAFEPPPTPSRSRWAGSAWAFIRNELGGNALAPGGSLGGSQAGTRLTYRLNNNPRRPLSLSARLYTPLDSLRGAEAALGLDWRPIAGLPINILAERRQALGPDGRSDFALMLHGGGETRIANGRLRIEGYGQAGIVGIEQRDLFADGGVTATTRIGPIDVGGGAWGGAQPGASRLDLGPHASFRLPIGRASIRAAAEWRFRVAGDAAPGSGPTLTISAGF